MLGIVLVAGCSAPDAPVATVEDRPVRATEPEPAPAPAPEPEPEPEPEPLPDDPREAVAVILERLGRSSDYDCLDYLFARESSWRPDAIGDDGDSFGLGQRNAPAHGAPPWPWPVEDQVRWFLEYADERYGGPCPAAETWRRRAEARDGRGWW